MSLLTTHPAPPAAGRPPRPGARLVDLTVPLGASPSEASPIVVDELSHADAPGFLGLPADAFPDGLGISNETVTLTTHSGTHMDAPLHYGPRSGGAPARSIDEIPLDWCVGRGVRLDVRAVPVGGTITVAHLEDAVRTGVPGGLVPGDIVLLWTGADALWGRSEYLREFPGLDGDSTRWLVEQGVHVIGTDAWGMDRPFGAMIGEYRETGDRSVLWPSHLYGREREYCQLEKLVNLGALPAATGFTVLCFPIPVRGAGAGWCRAVAALDDEPPAGAIGG
jgi:kynurenine formamidase